VNENNLPPEVSEIPDVVRDAMILFLQRLFPGWPVSMNAGLKSMGIEIGNSDNLLAGLWIHSFDTHFSISGEIKKKTT